MNRGSKPANQTSLALRPNEAAARPTRTFAQKESVMSGLTNTARAVAIGALLGTSHSAPFLFPAVLR